MRDRGKGFGGLGQPGGRETTRVSRETEVLIPKEIAYWMALGGDIAILGFYLIASIVWIKFDSRGWWEWLKEWWSFLFIPLIAWSCSVPILLVLLKWGLKQWNEHWPPVYKAADASQGLIGPAWGIIKAIESLGKRRITQAQEKTRLSLLLDELLTEVDDE